MEAECIKSLFLLVPIMSHDEHNYPTAPPIHQSKDGAQCRWSEWGTGYFGSDVWRDWGVGWLKMHTFQHHSFNMCIRFLTYWFSGSILEICAWRSPRTRSKNSNLLRWSRWTEWATFYCWQFNSPGSCQQQEQEQQQQKNAAQSIQVQFWPILDIFRHGQSDSVFCRRWLHVGYLSENWASHQPTGTLKHGQNKS